MDNMDPYTKGRLYDAEACLAYNTGNLVDARESLEKVIKLAEWRQYTRMPEPCSFGWARMNLGSRTSVSNLSRKQIYGSTDLDMQVPEIERK